MNRATIIGNLGADAEMAYTSNGRAVANARVATSERWKDSQGNQQESTEWHRVTIWGKLAESTTEFLTKGRQVMVTGKIRTRSWNDRDGNKRWTTEIHASELKLLGSRSSNSAPTQESNEAPMDESSVPF